MASTTLGTQLTQLHRQRQLALRAATIRDLVAIWPAFNVDDIDGTWPALERALVTLVNARHTDSAGLAVAYYRAYRQAESIPGNFSPLPAERPNATLLVATLNILGPIATKKAIARGQQRPAETMLTRLSGSVTRQVLDGSRRTLQESTKADPAARGWRRITGGNACSFCASIAAEGVVGADVDFPAHDHCSCTQEVAFS